MCNDGDYFRLYFAVAFSPPVEGILAVGHGIAEDHEGVDALRQMALDRYGKVIAASSSSGGEELTQAAQGLLCVMRCGLPPVST